MSQKTTVGMTSLVCQQPGVLTYQELPAPGFAPGHALLKIRRVGICGTDLHAFEGNQPFFDYPRILGHELAGDVIDFDDAPGFVRGEAVTFIPYFNCGNCIACLSGKPNCCATIKVCGVHIDGGMCEYLSVPTYSLVKGNGLSYEQLALVEPLAIGAHGVRRAGVQSGEFVLVVGAGPIGLGTMELAKIAGGKVIAMDTNEQRLLFCREKLHIQYTINPVWGKIMERLKEITGGQMAPVVIDATGNIHAINASFQYLAHGGRYILIGLQKEMIQFSHPEFHKREATVMSSRNALRADFDQVIECMKTGKIDPSTYITHRMPFKQLSTDFPMLLDPGSGVIKAMASLD